MDANGPSRKEERTNTKGNGNGNGPTHREEPPAPDAATNKQINYLLNIGKRNRFSTVQLEQRIEEVLGQQVGLYDLSKRDAAKVIDALTNATTSAPATRR